MKRHPLNFWAAWLALVVLGLMAVLVFPVAAQSATQVRLDPLTLGLKPGSQGSLTLVFDNAQDLYGLEVHLSFDPKVIEILDADPAKAGVQLTPADWLKSGFIAQNQVDNAAGTIDFAATLLNPALPVSGSKAFVTIQVRSKVEGNSPFNFKKVILANRDGKELPSQAQNGAVGVSASGTAPQAPSGVAGQGENAAATSDLEVWIALAGIGAFVVALGVVIVVLIRRRSA